MRCENCGSEKNVVKHHISYYPDERTVPLCESCHKEAHANKKHRFHPKEERPKWWPSYEAGVPLQQSNLYDYLKEKIALTPSEIADYIKKDGRRRPSVPLIKKLLARGPFKEVSGPYITDDLWATRNETLSEKTSRR